MSTPRPLVAGEGRPTLFCDRGCPFAHRVLALADHLCLALDVRMSAVGDKPVGLERYSRSGRIPLLVHEGLVLNESRVILEYLAELHGFADAWPESCAERTRHRHAMAVVDDFLARRLFFGWDDVDARRLDDVLDAIEAATSLAPPRPSLLAFHLAPIAQRFRWWHPSSTVTRAIEGRAALAGWLEAAGRLEAVARTAPELEEHMRDLELARAAALMA